MRATQYSTSLAEIGSQRFQRLWKRKLQCVLKDLRTTAKTLVNYLAKSGIVVSNETITRMDREVADQEKLPFCRKDTFKTDRSLQRSAWRKMIQTGSLSLVRRDNIRTLW